MSYKDVNPEAMNSRYTAQQIITLAKQNPARFLPSTKSVVILARAFFCELDEAKSIRDPKTGKEGPPQFRIMCAMVPGYDTAGITECYEAACADFWPRNPKGKGFDPIIKSQADRISVEDGGNKPTGKTLGGMIASGEFMTPNANKDYPPELYVYRGGKPQPFPRGDPGAVAAEFYSGIWTMVTLGFFKGTASQNPGVFPTLRSVTKIMDDNGFTGSVKEDIGAAFDGFKLDSSLDLGANFSGATEGKKASRDPFAELMGED